MARTGQRQPGEGVDRDGEEQVEELQGGVETVGVGIVAEDLTPEEVPDDQKRQMLGVVHALVFEREVVPAGQMADRDDDGIEARRQRSGWPKSFATVERRASVTTMWAVPEVERQAKSSGEAMANRGAATMIRIRC